MSDKALVSADAKTKAAAFRQMPPALQRAAKFMEGEINKANKSHLWLCWQLGKVIAQVINSTDREKYGGPGSVKLLASYFDLTTDTFTRYRNLYMAFDEKTFSWALEQRMVESGRMLTWPHCVRLMTVADENQRIGYLKDIFKYGWSPEELAKQITKDEGRLPRPGGRKVAVPKTLEGRLTNQSEILRIVIRNDEAIWRNEEAGILKAIETLPEEKLTPELAQQVEQSLAVLRHAQTVLTENTKMLQNASRLLSRKLGKVAQREAEETVELLTAGT